MDKHKKMTLEIEHNLSEIKMMLKDGFVRYQIYQSLKEQGKISCSKSWFYSVLSKYLEIINSSQKPKKEIIRPASEASEKTLVVSRITETEPHAIKKFHFDPKRKIPDEEL